MSSPGERVKCERKGSWSDWQAEDLASYFIYLLCGLEHVAWLSWIVIAFQKVRTKIFHSAVERARAWENSCIETFERGCKAGDANTSRRDPILSTGAGFGSRFIKWAMIWNTTCIGGIKSGLEPFILHAHKARVAMCLCFQPHPR